MLISVQSNTHSITFIDAEIEPSKSKIFDIGAIKSDGNHFHKPSLPDFTRFLSGSENVCGRYILNHDIKYVGKHLMMLALILQNVIDTLYLSPLLFSIKPYHALKDVWLDYFYNKKDLISQLVSGDTLRINADKCMNTNGQSVLKFSTKFKEKIDEMKSRHYELKSAKVNFILYWLKEGASQEIKIILPEQYFEKVIN
ncbi:hypothetical protein [Flavobacterium coralii]|uniref:hypothetical protein n=1 Tax=Flavobacterium coralii TaxID=2838017 RepID=UPI000C40ABD2|nr:hypothetical protein [Flavobacterium sp.]|tara:strand:- start:6340 stop:6933 length:594 start_codon:yes stop_codon:yes gene_type:complete